MNATVLSVLSVGTGEKVSFSPFILLVAAYVCLFLPRMVVIASPTSIFAAIASSGSAIGGSGGRYILKIERPLGAKMTLLEDLKDEGKERHCFA